MKTRLRKIPSSFVLLAVVLLVGVSLAAVGFYGRNDVALYAGLAIIAGGSITGALRLVVHGS